MVEGDISLKIHDTFLVPYDKLVILIDRPLTKEEIKKGQEAWVNKAISFHEHFLRILDQIDEKTQGRKLHTSRLCFSKIDSPKNRTHKKHIGKES